MAARQSIEQINGELPRRVRVVLVQAGLPACLVFFDVDEGTCTRRDAARSRSVGASIVARHCRSAREARTAVQHEHWDAVHVLGPAALESSELIRSPLPPDRRSERGSFDIVGDVHGCFAELEQLQEKLGYDGEGRHGQDRRLVFVGDLVDRGPRSLSVLRRVLDLVAAGRALFVPGNHDSKFSRWLRGRDVKISGGLETTVAEWELLEPPERESLRERFCSLMDASAPYLWLDGGSLVVAHAGLEEQDLGRVGRRIEAFCYYGKVAGKQRDGYPLRLDWAADYSGAAAVVYGHVPVRAAAWRNNTADVDLGCVYGGQLCAARWPERDFIQVPAQHQYWPQDSPARELPRVEDLPRS